MRLVHSSLGGKLNILLARYQKVAQAETNLSWTLQELSRYVHALRRSKQTGQPLSLERGGTPIDQLILETRGYSLNQYESEGNPLSPFSSQPRIDPSPSASVAKSNVLSKKEMKRP
jgi:hypothetical protein